jgi:PLP dependent protein
MSSTQRLNIIQMELRLRNPNTGILAVSKFQPADKIELLYDQGQRLFAENYAQEASLKQELLKELKIEWHFIGSLQKNKVKLVVGKFHLIHSVDSLGLAQAIDRKASELGLKQKILLQLNLAQEETKGGFTEANFNEAAVELAKLSHLEVQGLMTMPPLFDDPEMSRPYFKKLSNIRDQFSSLLPNLHLLSMGTSSDYLIAAEEGANLVRLGTILFGDRQGRP